VGGIIVNLDFAGEVYQSGCSTDTTLHYYTCVNDGNFTFSFSRPIAGVRVKGMIYAPADSQNIEISINGSPYTLLSSNLSYYESCNYTVQGNISAGHLIQGGGMITVTEPGITSIRIKNSGSDYWNFNIEILPFLTDANSPICEGNTLNLTADFGGVSGASYSWSGPNSFNSNLQNPSIANVTTAAMGTYTVTATDGVTTAIQTQEVVVNLTPNVVATPSAQVICSSESISTIALTGNVSGTNYAWTRDNSISVTGIPVSGVGDITGALTNTTNAPVLVTFTITPSTNDCSGNPISATVLVNPTPDVNPPADQTLCNGDSSSTIIFSGSVSGTIFNWTNDNPSIGLAASGIGDIASFTATNTTNAPLVATVTVTPTSPGANGVAYIPNANVNNVAVLDIATGMITATIPVGTTPFGVAITPDGSHVYITNFTSNNISVINTSTNMVDATIGGVGAQPYGIVVTPDGATVFVANESSNSISVINTTSNAVTGSFSVGSQPVSIVLSPDGSKGYVANFSSNNISVFNTATNAVIATIPVGNSPWGLAVSPDGSKWYVASNNTLSIFNSTTNTLITNVSVGTTPRGVVVSPDGAKVYVVNESGNSISVINAITNTLITTLAVGSDPWTVGITPDGISLLVNNFFSNDVSVINTTTNMVTGTIGGFSGPFALGNFISFDKSCSGAPETFTITVNPTPDATASASPNPACVGQTLSLSSSGGASYSWSGPIGFTSSLQNPVINNVQILHAGTYTVTVTSTEGCTATASVDVIVNPTPDAFALAIPTPLCQGETLNLYGLSNNGVSYAWSGPNSFSSNQQNPVITNIQPVSSGVYTLTVTNSNGCTNTATASVTVNPLPVVVVGATPNPICVGQTLSLSASGGAAYTWSGPNSFSSNQQNPIITDIQLTQAGVYTVTVTSTEGCTSTASVNVVVNPLPVPTADASPNPICAGKTLSLTSSGGVSYSWSGPSGYSSTQQNPSIANIQLNQGGVYFVTVTSQYGCTAATSVTVVVNPTPVATADASPNPICEGKKLFLTATGGVFYSWSGPNSFTSNLQDPKVKDIQLNEAGIYTVTVTNEYGCTSTASVNVIVNDSPEATIDAAPNPICVGKTLSLTSGGGDTYKWTGPNGFNSNIQNPTVANIQLNQAGLYIVKVKNFNGCKDSASVEVIVNELPIAAAYAVPNPICVGKTLSLTSTGGTSYAWSGPAGYTSSLQNPSIANIQLTQAGIYTVTVTNDNGCTDIASVNVVVNPLPVPTASASPNPICVGKTLSLFSSGGVNYLWNGPLGYYSSAQNPTIANIQLTQAGVYTVTVTNENGCTATASVNVVVNPLPVPTASASPNPICVGKTLSLTSSGGSSYAWSGPAGFSSFTQNPSIANIQLSQDGIYTVTVTNTYGCTSTASVDVVVNPLPTATATATPNPVCEGELATFTANGGVGYSWSGPGGFTSNSKSFGRHMALNMAGTYYVTVTNSNGCSSTASVSISVNPGPNATASVSPNPACSGQTVQFTASGGTTYQWTGPAGFSSTLQNPSINNAQQYNSGEYTVVVTNGSGCKSTVVLGLKVYQTPAGQISYDTKSTCTGGTLQLYASGGSSFQWSGPAGFSSTLQNPTRPNANSTFSGVYTVVISNTYGCSVTLSVSVTIRPLPVITAWTTTPEVCEGSTAYLYSNGGTSYSWSGPYGYGSTFQNPIITNMPTYMTGIYTVTGANEYGCTAKANVFITVQSVNAIVNATPNPVPNGGTLYLTASGGTSYQWTGPDGFHTTQQNPIVYKFTQPNEGLYSCIVSSSAGCQDTKIILVKLHREQ